MGIKSEGCATGESGRGGGKGENKWVWGFLSLWWIDWENRGSQKEKCKSRIALLPWHLCSLPIYLITSLLSVHFPPPSLLSPMTPLAPSLPLLLLFSSPSIPPAPYFPPLCPFIYLLIPTINTDKGQNLSIPLGFLFITLSRRGFKRVFLRWSLMTHLYSTFF